MLLYRCEQENAFSGLLYILLLAMYTLKLPFLVVFTLKLTKRFGKVLKFTPFLDKCPNVFPTCPKVTGLFLSGNLSLAFVLYF